MLSKISNDVYIPPTTDKTFARLRKKKVMGHLQCWSKTDDCVCRGCDLGAPSGLVKSEINYIMRI